MLNIFFQFTRASSMLSAGGIRHQFSLQENIEMSMFTSEFLRTIREHLSVLGNCYIVLVTKNKMTVGM